MHGYNYRHYAGGEGAVGDVNCVYTQAKIVELEQLMLVINLKYRVMLVLLHTTI